MNESNELKMQFACWHPQYDNHCSFGMKPRLRTVSSDSVSENDIRLVVYDNNTFGIVKIKKQIAWTSYSVQPIIIKQLKPQGRIPGNYVHRFQLGNKITPQEFGEHQKNIALMVYLERILLPKAILSYLSLSEQSQKFLNEYFRPMQYNVIYDYRIPNS